MVQVNSVWCRVVLARQRALLSLGVV